MILSSSASCTWLYKNPAAITVPIPPRPQLLACPSAPDIKGKVVETEGAGKGVLIPLKDANKLADWIEDTLACDDENEAILNGHIEKLENRLKAVGGKK